MKFIKLIIISFIIGSVLVGCSSDTEKTIYSEQLIYKIKTEVI